MTIRTLQALAVAAALTFATWACCRVATTKPLCQPAQVDDGSSQGGW